MKLGSTILQSLLTTTRQKRLHRERQNYSGLLLLFPWPDGSYKIGIGKLHLLDTFDCKMFHEKIISDTNS